jgi:hypothetical protein
MDAHYLPSFHSMMSEGKDCSHTSGLYDEAFLPLSLMEYADRLLYHPSALDAPWARRVLPVTV